MGMTILASAVTENENKYKLNINGFHKETDAKEKEELPKTSEEIMIEQFKEDNSPKKNRIDEIYGKFRAGKELTQEELKYLEKNNPEIYKEVIEIVRERKAMERQMELAKTKQEVSSVHINKMLHIKVTMGVGEQAKRQAQKTMARANQMSAAYSEFTASVEYQKKDDEKSQALRRREQLLEKEELLEELNQQPDDDKENTEIKQTQKEEDDKETEEKKRNKHRTMDTTDYKDFVDYELLKLKIDNLYHEINGYGGNKSKGRAGSGGVDLFL